MKPGPKSSIVEPPAQKVKPPVMVATGFGLTVVVTVVAPVHPFKLTAPLQVNAVLTVIV